MIAVANAFMVSQEKTASLKIHVPNWVTKSVKKVIMC